MGLKEGFSRYGTRKDFVRGVDVPVAFKLLSYTCQIETKTKLLNNKIHLYFFI